MSANRPISRLAERQELVETRTSRSLRDQVTHWTAAFAQRGRVAHAQPATGESRHLAFGRPSSLPGAEAVMVAASDGEKNGPAWWPGRPVLPPTRAEGVYVSPRDGCCRGPAAANAGGLSIGASTVPPCHREQTGRNGGRRRGLSAPGMDQAANWFIVLCAPPALSAASPAK